MFLSLCFLLSLASYGFSGVQSRENEYPGSYGARDLSAGFADDYGSMRKEAKIEMVNEGMDKVVSLAEALVEGTTPVNKRSGVFLASARPDLRTKIQEKLKDAQEFAEKMKQAM